jgi:hypothetical protein
MFVTITSEPFPCLTCPLTTYYQYKIFYFKRVRNQELPVLAALLEKRQAGFTIIYF